MHLLNIIQSTAFCSTQIFALVNIYSLFKLQETVDMETCYLMYCFCPALILPVLYIIKISKFWLFAAFYLTQILAFFHNLQHYQIVSSLMGRPVHGCGSLWNVISIIACDSESCTPTDSSLTCQFQTFFFHEQRLFY